MELNGLKHHSEISNNHYSTESNYVKLIYKLDKCALQELRNSFKSKVTTIKDSLDVEVGLNKDELVSAFIKIYGDDLQRAEVVEIFNKIDVENMNLIFWEQFLEFITKELQQDRADTLKIGNVNVFSPPHVKRDDIIKIVLIETNDYFCYAIISKYGRVGLFNGNLDFLTTYTVVMAREDINRNDSRRRRRNRWITDAIFMSDIMMLILVSTTRNMVIYDASGLKHVPIWLILGFPHIITSMAYKPPDSEAKRQLCVGTDKGKMFILYFQNQKERLFRKRHNDKINIFFYREICVDREYVVVKDVREKHEESVNIIDYLDDSDTIASCSADSNKSVSIIGIKTKRSYDFKMRRGTTCFAISDRLKILITGSDDGIIRIWNSVTSSRPLVSLNLHKSSVVDIVLMDTINKFLSLSKNGILKLWDLIEYTCLQSIDIQFPSLKIEAKTIDWNSRSIFPGPKRIEEKDRNCSIWERSYVLITCCNFIAKVNLCFLDGKERNLEKSVLQPPSLQNSFLVPKDWNAYCEDNAKYQENNDVQINLERLKFILDKNITQYCNNTSEINYKIAKLEEKKLEMQWAVEKCAAYLALPIYELHEVSLSQDLPLPHNRKIRSLVEKTQKMLNDASTRSIIFSEQTSSSKSPRSSRSSIVEFD